MAVNAGLTIPLIKAGLAATYQQQLAYYNFMGHFHQHWQAAKNCIVNVAAASGLVPMRSALAHLRARL